VARVDLRGSGEGTSTTAEKWSVPGPEVGCDAVAAAEFAFGEQGIEEIVLGAETLRPNDPRLEWFTLAGSARQGGPFPPAFKFSPYDRSPLRLPDAVSGFGEPFETGAGRFEVTDGRRRLPLPAALPTPGRHRVVEFAKAHHGFFACGNRPRLHALSEDGHVEWFASADLLAPEAKIEGHSYGDPFGRLLPRHRHAVAVGGRGFATVARGLPVWVRATPFLGEAQARDVCPCDHALGAPIFVDGTFHWPVRAEGGVKIASRRDEAGAPWGFVDCDGPAGDPALAPPHRRDGGVLVWPGEDGHLVVENGRPRWSAWADGHLGLTHVPPYVDVQGNLWQLTDTPGSYAFTRLGGGRTTVVPVGEYHVGAGRFTFHGRDVFDDPIYGDRSGELQVFDGALVVPVLAWENGAVVALVTLPSGTSPDDYFRDGGGIARTAYRLLSRADLSLRDLSAGLFKSRHHRDLTAFVFEGHLFLTSSLETRCIVWPLDRD